MEFNHQEVKAQRQMQAQQFEQHKNLELNQMTFQAQQAILGKDHHARVAEEASIREIARLQEQLRHKDEQHNQALQKKQRLLAAQGQVPLFPQQWNAEQGFKADQVIIKRQQELALESSEPVGHQIWYSSLEDVGPGYATEEVMINHQAALHAPPSGASQCPSPAPTQTPSVAASQVPVAASYAGLPANSSMVDRPVFYQMNGQKSGVGTDYTVTTSLPEPTGLTRTAMEPARTVVTPPSNATPFQSVPQYGGASGSNNFGGGFNQTSSGLLGMGGNGGDKNHGNRNNGGSSPGGSRNNGSDKNAKKGKKPKKDPNGGGPDGSSLGGSSDKSNESENDQDDDDWRKSARIKELEEIKIGKFPMVHEYRAWKSGIYAIANSASGRGDEKAMSWIMKPEKQGPDSNVQALDERLHDAGQETSGSHHQSG